MKGISADDSTILVNVANQCPETDGNAVYEARALLTQFNIYIFDDVCSTGTRMAPPDFSKYIKQTYTKVSSPIRTDEIKVYPNPNSGTFNLSINKEKNISSIILYNLEGNVVRELPVNKMQNIQGIVQGVYLLTIRYNDGQMAIKKIIIQ